MPLIDLFAPGEIGDADQCLVVTWLKREGDEISIGETILEIQAAKVTFEVPSPIQGRLVKILADQGEIVDQGQSLAKLEIGEFAALVERADPISKTSSDQPILQLSDPNTSPAVPIATTAEIRVSPVAKRLAKEYNIDLTRVIGSGADGRITETDLLAFINSVSGGDRDKQDGGVVIPLVGMRGAIAQRMLQSIQTTAQLTLTTEIDVSELVQRHPADKLIQPPITYTDHIVWASAQALKQHPALNAIQDNNVIRFLPEVNIGLAVSLEAGLIVPVIVGADTLTPEQIAKERVRLVAKARDGKLSSAEVSGSTFTVTNLGSYDIDAFTPILNTPELAILGVGRILEKPVVREGKIVARPMMTLSLTIDHRLVDGAPGAVFLRSVKHFLEIGNTTG